MAGDLYIGKPADHLPDMALAGMICGCGIPITEETNGNLSSKSMQTGSSAHLQRDAARRLLIFVWPHFNRLPIRLEFHRERQ